MTSRLKRKLNDLGVDVNSSRASENYCLIGTPLPPLEKSKDTGEFVPLWKQEVRDEKGRRRLHGAFTGGFSAGYFNTVGSKEGWTPSAFVSSRSERAKKMQVRPEDFMDEEDLAELRESQKLVDSNESMDLKSWERKKGQAPEADDSVIGTLENMLLPEPIDSAGGRILKKMGWRIGHGIGPKLNYHQHRRERLFSGAMSTSDVNCRFPEDHEEATRHLYPRQDTKITILARKDDRHGIGYDPGLGLSASVLKEEENERMGPNISAGFGLGALNYADEDDVDVYDAGASRSATGRLAYDETADNDVDSRWSKGPQAKDKQQQRFSSISSFFKSGVRCLAGFAVASEPLVEKNSHPPPDVPKEWKPDPQKIWKAGVTTLKEVSSESEGTVRQDKSTRKPTLDIDKRGEILGETRLPKAARSVFDYLSQKDRDRLRNLATSHVEKSTHSPQKADDQTGPPEELAGSSVPRLDAQLAKMALQGFQPFSNDPIKHARYSAYLHAQAKGEDTVPFTRLPEQKPDSFQKELEDYARSARIFRPVSGAMAGRFSSAKVVETGPKSVEGLHKPIGQGSYLPNPEAEVGVNEQPEKEESPKENAARLGMYGALTREIKPWVPEKLLCKRFGVKPPEVEIPDENSKYPSAAPQSTSNTPAQADNEVSEVALIGSSRISDGDEMSGKDASNPYEGKGRDLASVGYGDTDETQGRDILSFMKPAKDIFKAIFASDEEDQSDGDGAQADETPAPSANGDVPSRALENGQSIHPEEPLTTRVPEEGIGVGTFKPKFVPRHKRDERALEKGDGSKDKRERREKKKKAKALVSFDLDEGSENFPGKVGNGHEESKRESKRQKKRDCGGKVDRYDEAENMEDESMWVEKPPPDAVRELHEKAQVADPRETGQQRNRKRAIDFM